jgi:hypothetical protein
MNDLRTEIRTAFEKEQSGHAPDPMLRHDVLAAVAARPRRAPGYPWLAAVAAVLLALLVVAGLMSIRLAGHSSVPSAPEADYGPPPAGVPLVYVHDPKHAGWLIGFDWNGKPRATVKFTDKLEGSQSIKMAPDGQHFAIVPSPKGGTWQLFDRLGRPTGSFSITDEYEVKWADDSTRLCALTMDPLSLEYALWVVEPVGNPRPVAMVARDSAVGQTGLSIAACSFGSDRAILVRTTINYPSEVWVVKLSDGTMVSHHTYPANALSTVIASSDAVYLVENSAKGSGSEGAESASSTTVRRVTDWAAISVLDPTIHVLTFSSDDMWLLATTAPYLSTAPTHLSVVEWGSGTILWSYDGPEALASFVAQPGGLTAPQLLGFALALSAPDGGTPDPRRDILIMNGCCAPTQLSGRYVPAW